MLGTWRKPLELAFFNHRLISEVNRFNKVNWLIIDLGIKHVTAEHINEVLDSMLVGFNRLFKYKKVKQANLGYFRMLDIIIEEERFNPVIHVLLPTIKSYFQGRYYIKLSEWSTLWYKALDMRPEYDLSVEVNTLNSKRDQLSIIDNMEQGLILLHNVPERPQTKSNDMISSRRLIGYSRLLKDHVDRIHPKIEYNLHHYDINDPFANHAFNFMSHWHSGIRSEEELDIKQSFVL